MTGGRQVSGLARACHLAPTVTVTTVAAAFAAFAGRGAGTVWVAAAVIAGQLSVGWSNDYVDRERDVAAGRADKPIVAGDVSARVVAVASAVALVAALALSFASGWRAVVVHAVGLAAGWSYNLGVKATVWSPVPYAVAFAALPAFVVVGLPGNPSPPGWIMVAGALLGMGAHFANVLPDMADDIRLGVVGLPHRGGYRASTVVAGALLVSASVLLVLGPSTGPGILGVAALAAAGVLAGAMILPLASDSRTPFRLAMAIALLDTVMFVARGQSVIG